MLTDKQKTILDQLRDDYRHELAEEVAALFRQGWTIEMIISVRKSALRALEKANEK